MIILDKKITVELTNDHWDRAAMQNKVATLFALHWSTDPQMVMRELEIMFGPRAYYHLAPWIRENDNE